MRPLVSNPKRHRARRSLVVPIAFAVAASLAAPGPANASSSVGVRVEASAGSYDSVLGESVDDASPVGPPVSLFDPVAGLSYSHLENRSAGSGTASAYGSAAANPGGVHVVATVSASGAGTATTNSGGSGHVDVSAASGDQFVLFAPGLPPGEPLTMAASVSFTGSTLALAGYDHAAPGSGNATAIWEGHLSLVSGSAGLNVDRVARCDHESETLVCTGSEFGSELAPLVVANGAVVIVSVSGRANAVGGADQTVTGSAFMNASADLGNTIAWGGIASLTDSGGNPVGEYSATGATTGFDYRYAYAPEPGAAVLAADATGMLALVARRRSMASRRSADLRSDCPRREP